MSAKLIPAEAQNFIHFVNKSPSPFHAVLECKQLLLSCGFTEISEKAPWSLKPNSKYFFTRNHSSLVAFAIGGKFVPGNGFSIVGAHTDSPCLKLKPVSKKEKVNYLQVGVQLYGGGLWHTWFDRDLGLSGRVMLDEGNGVLEQRLVSINRPILRIPTLAIHLDRGVNEAFKFNNETHLTPIIASSLKGLTDASKDKKDASAHHAVLLNILKEELLCDVNSIQDLELCLHDVSPATIGGACNEFIFSPRLDNLMMSYCSLMALVNSKQLEKDDNVRVAALFDNEEVGSQTAQGADSNMLIQVLRRITNGMGKAASPTAFDESVHKSFLISADMAHAIHPNYSDKHEENHQPQMHKGVVIKHNANQRYATTSVTSFILKQLAKKKSVPLQEFVVRNDSPCGSTIGPMLSAKLGLRTIDVGNPQLSMHSIREMGGTDDVGHAITLFESFYENFAEIDKSLKVDC